jgi:hypothetical protein
LGSKSATSKNLTVKSTSSHITTISPGGKTYNQTDHVLRHRQRHSSILDVQSFQAADCDNGHTLVVAKVRERLAVNKQRSHKFHIEGFNLKKLKKGRG